MCAKGNPKFSCPTILSHSDDESLGSESDSREELFDSSLDTVNVSVNTELPMNSSHSSEEEEFDFLHLYEELSDYDFHRMMSVDDFTYSTAFSNEVFDNGEWYTYAGLETCNMKSARHGKELLSKSIQSTTTQGDSGIDDLTCLSGDDTKLGTDQTKADVYESSNNMSEGKSISIRVNLIVIWKMMSFLYLKRLKSFQRVMMENIFWQKKVLSGLWMHPLKVFPVLLYHIRTTLV